jgi:hypothetical protein
MKTLNPDIGSARSEDVVAAAFAGSSERRPTRNCRFRAGGPPYRTVLVPLMRHDPMKINHGEGPEVYLPDSEAISARLDTCDDEAEVCRVVHEELCEAFGPGAVGSLEHCAQVAHEIWELWQTRV